MLRLMYKRYGRHFRQPLRTARGEWGIREGFILRVEAGDHVSFGEVAPLPEFGTETVDAAGAFLEELVLEPMLQVPKGLPCVRFGLSAALGDVSAAVRDYPVSALLPAGSAVHASAAQKIESGYRSLKWKIGVESSKVELEHAARLFRSLPAGVTLRLDANASLSSKGLKNWAEFLSDHREKLDYLEQPLAVGGEALMAECMTDTGIPIALDESLNGMQGGQWLEPGAWSGPLVIKPLLMGDRAELLARLQPLAEQVVFSSVFESGIGLLNALQLADALPLPKHALGFDTITAFDDGLNPGPVSPTLMAADRAKILPETIWNQLPHSN